MWLYKIVHFSSEKYATQLVNLKMYKCACIFEYCATLLLDVQKICFVCPTNNLKLLVKVYGLDTKEKLGCMFCL